MTPNRIVHFEIPADDVARAVGFYQKTFGWKIDEFPGMEYWSVRTTPVDDKQVPTEVGGINGGLTKRSSTARHPSVTVDVVDIENTLAAIEKSGGKTLQPKTPIGEMGFVAMFQDTEGNAVGLWQSTK